VGGYPGHAQNELDARIKDLRVRFGRPVGGIVARQDAAPRQVVPARQDPGRGWLAAVLIIGGMLVLLLATATLAGVFYFARRAR
jgi:hypothetical protein